MKSSVDRDLLDADRDAERVEATKTLPLLRMHREKLEREAGELGAAAQRHQTVIAIVAGAAGIAVMYSLWRTLTAEPPIVAWVIAAALAIGAAAAAKLRNDTKRERDRHLDALHDKMHSISRRIATAERRLGV